MLLQARLNTRDEVVKFFDNHSLGQESFKDSKDLDMIEAIFDGKTKVFSLHVLVHYKKIYFRMFKAAYVFEGNKIRTEWFELPSSYTRYGYAEFLEKKREVWFKNLRKSGGGHWRLPPHRTLADIEEVA